jgi:hypothetical protein
MLLIGLNFSPGISSKQSLSSGGPRAAQQRRHAMLTVSRAKEMREPDLWFGPNTLASNSPTAF